MKRFWDRAEGDQLEVRLRAEAPQPSQQLIDRIGGEITGAPVPRQVSRARKGAAIAFAALMLTSSFGAVALAKSGGNGGGNNGGGNGNSGTPAGCTEGNGKVIIHNTNC